ncbi:GNAT family N-acetyltransferase [Methylobacterium sp. P5_C11]
MMSDREQAWRIEEACLNAWPSPRALLVHGYLLRAAGGSSKRQNSMTPMRGSGAPEPAIEAARALYARLGQRAIFRVPAIAPQMEPLLKGLDFAVVDETCTLFRVLDDLSPEADPTVTVAAAPGADWLALRDAVNRADGAAARVFRDTVAALVLPTVFAAAQAEGGIGAIAFGVLDRDLLVIESVATREALRGRGHARRAVGALLRWGRRQGARAACLQVVAANAPARALYRSLGFAREVYRYHYRVALEAQ